MAGYSQCNDESAWLGHIYHLSLGTGYIDSCPVCNLKSGGLHTSACKDETILKNIKSYHAAQTSGRNRIPLDEMYDNEKQQTTVRTTDSVVPLKAPDRK